MHVEKQIKKSGKYYYLAENIRLSNNRWKKVRVYLGKNLDKKKLHVLRKRKKNEISQKIREEKESIDRLLTLISDKQLKKLEEIKKLYNKRMKKTDKLQYQNYYESFVTEFTYDTNAIEGSTVTLQETALLFLETKELKLNLKQKPKEKPTNYLY